MAARWRFLPRRPFPQRHLQPALCTRPAGWNGNVGVCWLSASLSCLGPVGNNSMGRLICYAHSLNGKPLDFPQSHHKQRHVKIGLWKAFRLKTGKCGAPIPATVPEERKLYPNPISLNLSQSWFISEIRDTKTPNKRMKSQYIFTTFELN